MDSPKLMLSAVASFMGILAGEPVDVRYDNDFDSYDMKFVGLSALGRKIRLIIEAPKRG